ncbi:MAG TPA: ParB N-terminal domain-containing protein [Nocardioides sp.]|nr:ParB N-terminal domain-containing protein [Nocardioides sp.]
MIALMAGGHRQRLRRWGHRALRLVRAAERRVLEMAGRAPIPVRWRRWLSDLLLWRRRTTPVPVGKVLLGGQNGMSAADFAARTGDLLWPSRRVVDGPHAELLRAAATHELTDDEILVSDYGRMARQCIEISGQYFSATDDRGILDVARAYLARSSSRAAPPAPPTARRPHQSRPGTPPLVAPVRDSDCYQVIDGHHRVAALSAAGVGTVDVRLRRAAVSTPLQDVLDRMSWIGGTRELYQPVAAPELEKSWTTVRRCTDRFEAMRGVLGDLGLAATESSYLDVASCYGWFLAGMADLGYAVEGIERDPLAPVLGAAVHGLDPRAVTTGDAVAFLRSADRAWDVVSCFSLLHHFALGHGSVDPAGLVRLLDHVTGRVLFLDTGQAHEAWFRDTLPEWDTAAVHRFLEHEGTFDRVVDLGPDHDAVTPYDHNYGRHLFACIRDR